MWQSAREQEKREKGKGKQKVSFPNSFSPRYLESLNLFVFPFPSFPLCRPLPKNRETERAEPTL
jgi:hypothetical protein